MLRLVSDYAIENELGDVVRLFFDVENQDVDIECNFVSETPFVTINGEFFNILSGNLGEKKFSRHCKAQLYNVLSAYTGKTFPWGALTGVRPTKLGYEIAASGEDIAEGLKVYGVSTRKAETVKKIIENQKGFGPSRTKVNFYVHIPFCTSRCNYCSFVSLPVEKHEKLIREYVTCLTEEIREGVKTLSGAYEVDSVYIGGGTPTALDEELFERVLDAIPYRGLEYTVEAGRPDTITDEKLDIMARHGVTRISVNPQSFSDKTLALIGRNHTADDIKRVYKLAKGRFIVNMDIIAGLADETVADFDNTISEVIALKPENVTVHTLARKNGSAIKQERVFATGVKEMVERAYDRLTEAGYLPYYLYRQKNMLENLENIGYALPGTVCANNVTTMEEFYSVFACGAGAISKRLFDGGRIERLANVRDVGLYIAEFAKRLEKKTNFFR